MSLNVQQFLHLALPLPYDVTNIVNSFLFYDLKTGAVRKCKKKINGIFTRLWGGWSGLKSYSTKHTSDTMSHIQTVETDHVTRLTYNVPFDDSFDSSTPSIYIVLNDEKKKLCFWSAFCSDCGDYTVAMQNDDWEVMAEREQYSPNTDVLCLCGLHGVVNPPFRRRPYPLGRVLDSDTDTDTDSESYSEYDWGGIDVEMEAVGLG
jgi:hypothetical protein